MKELKNDKEELLSYVREKLNEKWVFFLFRWV
jgi:hypothetical protein